MGTRSHVDGRGGLVADGGRREARNPNQRKETVPMAWKQNMQALPCNGASGKQLQVSLAVRQVRAFPAAASHSRSWHLLLLNRAWDWGERQMRMSGGGRRNRGAHIHQVYRNLPIDMRARDGDGRFVGVRRACLSCPVDLPGMGRATSTRMRLCAAIANYNNRTPYNATNVTFDELHGSSTSNQIGQNN